jgi:hypothetical protein
MSPLSGDRAGGASLWSAASHCYEAGGMRRWHVRGHENILKRQLIHMGAFNLSLILRNCWVQARRGSGRTAVACLFCLLICCSPGKV